MRRLAIAPVLFAALAALAQTARADGPPPPCGVEWAPGLQPAACSEPAPRDRDPRDLADRTHVSVLPTGALTPSGDVSVQVHGLGAWNRIAFGVGDHLELSASAPVIPIVTNVGARLSLTPPRSPLRLVVGASAWIPLYDDGSAVQGTITVAYQSERTNFHASATSFMVPHDGDGPTLFGYDAGIAHRTSDRIALFADLVRVAWLDNCADCGGPGYEAVHGLVLGAKVMGDRWDYDLGFFVALIPGDDGPPAVPLISITRRY